MASDYPLNITTKQLVKDQVIKILEPFSIDLNQYRLTIHRASVCTCEAVFKHKKTKAIIRITEIWYSETEGIMQCGSQYGELIF